MAELELKTLKQLVYNAEELYGDEIFLREYIDKKFRDTSFREFRKSCDDIAVWIQKHFTEKTHIALVGATSLEYLSAWFGVQCSCNVSVPLDTNNSPENIADEPGEDERLSALNGSTEVNILVGISNSGSVQAYLPLLKVFYESIDEKADELESFYNEGDIKDYTIKVHALKSSSRVIGASELSAMAAELEKAGSACCVKLMGASSGLGASFTNNFLRQ